MPYFLQAGPVRVRYENGFLRYFTVDDAEILRMVYFAIRNHNWLTASFTITDEVVTQATDSFRIQYAFHTTSLGIELTGQVVIEGDSEGTVSVDFSGKAINSFRKNRIGLCVLHPIEGVLGQPVAVTAPDGSITTGHFPTFISPHQPFLNMRSMRWKSASGSTWQLDFSGDVFETEDQRNWTDASFKTYSTALAEPFPLTASAGDKCWQRVVFSRATQPVSGEIVLKEAQELQRALAQTEPARPFIGVGQRVGGPPLTASEATLLRKLNLSHLRADVFFSLPNWQDLLTNATADAQLLAVPLELALFLGDDPATEVRLLQYFLSHQSVPVRSMLLFNAGTLTTSDILLQAVVPVLRAEWTALLIGGGTDDNFAELNRHPFDFELVDFVSYSINPQVHAFDDLTLLENIDGQPDTVLSARQLSGGKPIHISPVTLLPRNTTRTGAATERLNASTDPRQTTEFAADWTRRSLSALAKAGVQSVTYYQSHGPAGLVDGDTVYPLYNVFE